MADGETDRIHIRDLMCRCIVGIYPDERREKQDVIINITLWANYRAACRTDDIADTVDYKTIKKQVIKMVEESVFSSSNAWPRKSRASVWPTPASRRSLCP